MLQYNRADLHLRAGGVLVGSDHIYTEQSDAGRPPCPACCRWMEVRDALQAGKTTVLVATGGLEQSRPSVAIGKHNYVLRATD